MVGMRHILLTLALGTLATAIPVYAHHSFAAFYFEDQSVTIQGEVSEFLYKNPHAILMVKAPDAAGVVRNYAAEFAGPGRLARQGVTKDTLKPGDQVIVTGSPGRIESDYKIHLKRVQRMSDGWSWGGDRRR